MRSGLVSCAESSKHEQNPPRSGLSDKRKGIYEASRCQTRSTRLVHIDTAAWRPQEGRLLEPAAECSASGFGIRLAYSVTPGSLTLWSVQLLRRIHRSTAPVSTSNAAIKPNALASIRRFPISQR